MTKQNKMSKRKLSNTNFVLAAVAILTDILMVLGILNITRYSNFSKPTFILINVVILAILLILNGLIAYNAYAMKKNILYVTIGVLVIAFLSGGALTYVTTRVNKNVDKIINSGTTSEKVEVSFVVYSENGNFTIDNINDLEGKTFGILSNTEEQVGYILPKKELEAKKINVTYREYDDYNTMLMALFSGEIDAAALPSNYVAMFEVNDGYSEFLDNTKAILTFDKNITVTTESGSDKDITKEPFTVLIIGTDEQRSDALMLASFNPISMQVTLTSIARDSYVPIACYAGKSEDKITHARIRSRQCTIDTVEDLMDVDIDFYFESNFAGVVEMVDALGGVIITNPYEFVGQKSDARGKMTVWVPAGTNRLNGEQALAYARERHLYANGDFQRQANQQQVIQAILTEAMKLTDVNKALNVLDAAGENVSTNFSVDQLISLFNYSIKKMNRSYVKNANVINMVGSRVTGYGSSKWNESMQLSLYIYRVYQGSVTDNRNAILRNINLDSKIDAPKAISFSANWVFTAPTLSNETYSEPIIHDEVPDTVINFSGKQLSEVQEWAASRKITIHVNKIHQGQEGYVDSYAENTVVGQSVRPGIKTENVTEITVNVITHEGATKNCPANSYYDSGQNACVCESGYYAKNDSDLNPGGAGCIANPTSTPTATPQTPTITPTPSTPPTSSPTPTNTPEHIHDWSGWEITIEATCGADGERKRTCKTCNESQTESIPATGNHTLTHVSEDKECVRIEYDLCSVCGAILNRHESAIEGCGTKPEPSSDTDITNPDTEGDNSQTGEGQGSGSGETPAGFIFSNRIFNLFGKIFK